MEKIEFLKKYDKLFNDPDLTYSQKFEQVLVDVVKKYVQPNTRCEHEGACSYSGEKVGLADRSCAVGMLLTKESRSYLDYTHVGSIYNISRMIKIDLDFIGENIQFFQDLQDLHDHAGNWDYENNKLTFRGTVRVRQVCNTFNIPVEKLQVYFND